ncbi:hypothetical protein QAO71_10695 [Halopseudomonas sp. SMJS2]|uniref:hypothetical protein n=1 Tax=Halopseudomonas sp. SMJS2 TaxID=3041098 RepID=UPI0024530383|nr:hypothetical protein [Halopseudomonas sp. SMJS2]WGK60561.1 hypothetical protein QAO71_10695 [Halopseudomonas sp. SMJS2]
MTTSKPEVVAWTDPDEANVFAGWFKNQLIAMGGNDGHIAETCDIALIRLSDYEALQVLCDRLQLEAQCHAQEARTANATIAEIYRLVSGGTGEPGNWNGTEPVRRKLEELQAECERLRKDAETEQAIQRAAEVLPPGYRIEIEVENDAGSVALFAPGAIVECDFQGGIAEQIADAINTAMQGDQP